MALLQPYVEENVKIHKYEVNIVEVVKFGQIIKVQQLMKHGKQSTNVGLIILGPQEP